MQITREAGRGVRDADERHGRGPTLSIVTVVLNDPEGVAATLDSVDEQEHPPCEHVIVDGASTDETLAVIDMKRSAVTRIVSEPDDGIYYAMNKGLAQVSGDVVHFLNAGDVFAGSDVVGRVLECFQDREVGACYGDITFFDETGRTVRRWRSGTFKKWKVYLGWAAPHSAFFAKRELYERLGGFRSDLRNAGDYEFMLRCFLELGIKPHYLRSVLAHMRIGGFSNASARNILLGVSEVRSAWRRNGLAMGHFAPYGKPLSKIPQYLFPS